MDQNTIYTSIVDSCFKTATRTKEFTWRRIYKWNLPRQCGITTDLIKLAYRLATSENKIVMLAAHNSTAEIELKSKVQRMGYNPKFERVIITNVGSERIRGRSVDYIFIDNGMYSNVNSYGNFLMNSLPAITSKGGLIMELNTTEGA